MPRRRRLDGTWDAVAHACRRHRSRSEMHRRAPPPLRRAAPRQLMRGPQPSAVSDRGSTLAGAISRLSRRRDRRLRADAPGHLPRTPTGLARLAASGGGSIRRLSACVRLPRAKVNLATRGLGPAAEDVHPWPRRSNARKSPPMAAWGRRRRAVGACRGWAGCAAVRSTSGNAARTRSTVARSREWTRPLRRAPENVCRP